MQRIDTGLTRLIEDPRRRRLIACSHLGRAEQAVEDGDDMFPGVGELEGEGIDRHIEHRGDARLNLPVIGQPVGLGIVLILQGVFDAPQQLVSLRQTIDRLRIEQAPLRERLQGDQGAAVAKQGVPAPAHHLEELRAELDFPDAAAADLDVDAAAVAGIPAHTSAARLGPDEFVQIAHCVNGCEVEVAAIDEGFDDSAELRFVGASVVLTGQSGVGDHQCLDPGKAFPFTALVVEIVLEHRQVDHQRSGVAVGAQSGIDPKDKAVFGDVRQRPAELAGCPMKEFAAAQATVLGLTAIAVRKDQVDVRGHIQFVAADLAHADHQQVLRRPFAVERTTMDPRKLGGGMPHGHLDRANSPGADRTAHLGKRRLLCHIAFDDRHDQELAHPSQCRPRVDCRSSLGGVRRALRSGQRFDRRPASIDHLCIERLSGECGQQLGDRRLSALQRIERPTEPRRMRSRCVSICHGRIFREMHRL